MNNPESIPHKANKESISSGVVTQTAWALASKIIVSVLATFTAVFIMRELEPHQYGAFSLAVSVAALWFILAEFGISLSVSKHVAQYRGTRSDLAHSFVGYGLVLQAVFAVGISIACYLSAGYVARLLGAPELELLLRVASVILLARPLQMLALRVFQGFQTLNLQAAVEVARETIRLAATVSLIYLGLGATGAVAGRAAGFAAAAVVGLLIVCYRFVHGHRWRGAGGHPVVKQVMHLSLPVLVTVACQYIYTEFSITITGYFLDTEQVGYYSLPARVTIVLLMLAQAIALATAPRLATARESDKLAVHRLFLGSMKVLLILYIPAMVGLIALTPELLTVVVGPKYLPSCTVMRMYAVYLSFRAASTLLAPGLVYLGRARARAAVMMVTALANVGLHLVLVPRFGIIGAAAAMLATYIPTVLIYAFLACRTIELPLRGLVHLALRIVGCALVMGAVVYLIGHDGYSFLRLSTTIVAGIVVYFTMLVLMRIVTPSEIRDVIARRWTSRRQGK